MLMPLTGLCAETANNCTRGEPYPAFSKNRPEIQSRQFFLISAHEAREKIQLRAGGLIRIRHTGCEYYVTTFKFESKELMQGNPSIRATYREAALWLRKLEQLKADSIFKLGLAADTLEQASGKSSDVKIADAFAVDGDGTDFLQTQVRIDRTGRNGPLGFIEVSLFKGPL